MYNFIFKKCLIGKIKIRQNIVAETRLYAKKNLGRNSYAHHKNSGRNSEESFAAGRNMLPAPLFLTAIGP